jgi:hypothetical protein
MAQEKKVTRSKSNNGASLGYKQQRWENGALVAETTVLCRLTTDTEAELVVFTPLLFAKAFRTQL